MTDIEELKRVAEAATQGHWAYESCGEKGDGANMIGIMFGPDDPNCETQLHGFVDTNQSEYDENTGKHVFPDYYRDEVVAICEHRDRNPGGNAKFITTFDPPTVLSLLSDLERMREALEFFAKRENYHDTQNPDGTWRTAQVLFRGRRRAAQALGGTDD